MPNPSLGIRRACQGCLAPFYDLNKSPILCPKCGIEFKPIDVMKMPSKKAEKAPSLTDEEAESQNTLEADDFGGHIDDDFEDIDSDYDDPQGVSNFYDRPQSGNGDF